MARPGGHLVAQGGAVRLFLPDGREVAGLAAHAVVGAAGVMVNVLWLDYTAASPQASEIGAARQATQFTAAEFGGAGTVAPPYWLEA